MEHHDHFHHHHHVIHDHAAHFHHMHMMHDPAVHLHQQAAALHQMAVDASMDSAQAQMAQMQQPAPQRRLRRSAGAPVRRPTRAAKIVALALVCALLGIAVVYGAIFLALFRQQF